MKYTYNGFCADSGNREMTSRRASRGVLHTRPPANALPDPSQLAAFVVLHLLATVTLVSLAFYLTAASSPPSEVCPMVCWLWFSHYLRTRNPTGGATPSMVFLICPSNINVLNGCIFGELATDDKLDEQSKRRDKFPHGRNHKQV